MALERSVMMQDGIVRRYHKITNIQHILDQVTLIDITSKQYDANDDSIASHTTLSHSFDDSLTFLQAYNWMKEQPEFAEYIDEQETQLVEAHTQLIAATEQVSNLQDSITTLTTNLGNVLTILTDDQALSVSYCFDEWATDTLYSVNNRVLYNNILYKCVQEHTSQDNWTPDVTSALWTRIALPDTIDEWRQPTGAQDSYFIGDKVSHNGDIWISVADNNVWEPGVYGWDVYSE